MTSSISSVWQSFWHTMTSYDRHASHDSPYRTGRHVPLAQSRHHPLTSVVTSASDSHTDLPDTDSSHSSASANQAQSKTEDGVPMQPFSDGVAPPPPVSHSWQRIDRWLDKNYAEMYDNLGEGCTQNDINELEHILDHTLPLEVRDSLMCHDGQERGGLPSGILFGCMLLDCEEIFEEWSNWQRVGAEYFSESAAAFASLNPSQSGPFQSSSSSSAEAGPSSAPHLAPSYQPSSAWSSNLMSRQTSFPENAIQSRYTSPYWIPLARDWGGNCIAVDLSPGPAGRYGQVILFGRDYDMKVLVARSWAAFIASVADDFETGKAQVIAEDDDIASTGAGAAGLGDGNGAGQLWLREFRADTRRYGQDATPPIVPFIQILRIRAENRYGKRTAQPPRPRQSAPRMPADSFRGSSKSASKRPMIASPLSRVMEESSPAPSRLLSSGPSSPAVSSYSPSFPQSSTGFPGEGSSSGVPTIAEPSDILLPSSSNGNTTVPPKIATGLGVSSKNKIVPHPAGAVVDLSVDKEN